MPHIPVLLKETIEILNPQPGEFFIDGTIGSGGHAVKIFEKILPSGKLLGLDLDENNLKIAESKILTELRIQKSELRNDLILIQGNYADLPEILEKHNLSKASGLLLDLGFSSEHLESGRGFTFQKNEPLNMRYQFRDVRHPEIVGRRTSEILTAADVVNTFSENDLAEIFWKYGEEKYSRQIAKKIIEQRKIKLIKTTFDLIEIIGGGNVRIHPATRVFQALRIYVNDELGNLEKALKNIGKIMQSKGRIAIISYHSLEDRLVKNCFRDLKNQGKARILTKKPIRPSKEEIISNQRSRSAKLRAVIMQHEARSM